MKKILALCLSALLVLTSLVGIMAVSAEDEITPIYLVDGNNLNPVGGVDCEGTYSFDKGYITLTATGIDPYYNILSAPEEDPITVGPIFSVKYRVTSDVPVQGQLYVCYNSNIVTLEEEGVNTHFEYDYICDGEWQVAIIDLTQVVDVEAFDPETNVLKAVRNDFFANPAPVGLTIDVEYYAFFDTEDDAEAYFEQDMHVLPEKQGDGSHKTLDFGGDFEEIQSWFSKDTRVDIEILPGMGYTTFKATGADPYVRFNDLSDGTFQVKGYEAKYILVKYRTEADSYSQMKMEFFTNVVNGPQWGDSSVHAEGNIVNDGEWHYDYVDSSATIATHANTLYAFRIDPLAEATAGDTIDIELIKMFSNKDDMEDFLGALADEEDPAAMDYFDRYYAPAPDTTTQAPETTAEPDVVETTTAAVETEKATDTEAVTEVVTEVVTETEVATDVETDADTDAATAGADTAATGETTTEAPAATTKGDDTAATGCKAVIASASALAVVALAAGVVVCKKKD